VHLLLALLLLAGLAMFTLDWLQVRNQMPAEGSRSLDLAGVRAAGMAALTCILCGWGGLTTLRATRLGKSARRDGSPAPLLAAQGRDETTP